MTQPGGAQREFWTVAEQYRFEDRLNDQLREMQFSIDRLTARLTLLMGGVGLLAFMVPIVAPLLRSWLNLPT